MIVTCLVDFYLRWSSYGALVALTRKTLFHTATDADCQEEAHLYTNRQRTAAYERACLTRVLQFEQQADANSNQAADIDVASEQQADANDQLAITRARVAPHFPFDEEERKDAAVDRTERYRKARASAQTDRYRSS